MEENLENQNLENQNLEKKEEEYSEVLKNLKKEENEEEILKSQSSELENLVRQTNTTQNNILKYLNESNHPKKAEFNQILEDIKNANYSIKDENLHTDFIATKIFLQKNDLPNSLKKEFDVLESATNLTPKNLESLKKVKHFTESAIEKNLESISLKKIDNVYGNQKKIDKNDFEKMQNLFDCGKISKEEYNKAKIDFLNSTELKRRNLQIFKR